MNIIICDDELYWSEELKTAIIKWAEIRNIHIKHQIFAIPQELLRYLANNHDVDVLFLDITFGEQFIDGMTLAKHLRKTGFTIPIIFITADSLRAADGYLVEAMGFLSKPIEESRLSLFLDRIVRLESSRKIIKLVADGQVINMYQKELVYVEIKDHTVTYHTEKGNLSFRGTLSKVLSQLDVRYFIQIHRSYIVALEKIDSIKTSYPHSVNLHTFKKLINLPVSRKYISRLIEVYSDDLLEKTI